MIEFSLGLAVYTLTVVLLTLIMRRSWARSRRPRVRTARIPVVALQPGHVFDAGDGTRVFVEEPPRRTDYALTVLVSPMETGASYRIQYVNYGKTMIEVEL